MPMKFILKIGSNTLNFLPLTRFFVRSINKVHILPEIMSPGEDLAISM